MLISDIFLSKTVLFTAVYRAAAVNNGGIIFKNFAYNHKIKLVFQDELIEILECSRIVSSQTQRIRNELNLVE